MRCRQTINSLKKTKTKKAMNEIVSIAQVDTQEEINTLIESAQQEQSKTETEIRVLQEKLIVINKTGDKVEIDLEASKSEFESISSMVANTNNDAVKAAYEGKIKRLDLKVFNLNSRLKSYGPIAQVEVEFDLKIKQLILAEFGTYLTALQARKAEIPA
jgi:hypothetical protein